MTLFALPYKRIAAEWRAAAAHLSAAAARFEALARLGAPSPELTSLTVPVRYRRTRQKCQGPILQLLASAPEPMYLEEIMAGLHRQGLTSLPKSVKAALRRLELRHAVQVVDGDRYQLGPTSEEGGTP